MLNRLAVRLAWQGTEYNDCCDSYQAICLENFQPPICGGTLSSPSVNPTPTPTGPAPQPGIDTTLGFGTITQLGNIIRVPVTLSSTLAVFGVQFEYVLYIYQSVNQSIEYGM